jgi:integrase
MKIKLTNSSVCKLHFSGESMLYWDTKLAGFGLRVGRNSKVFIVQERVDGKSYRVRIGKYGTYTLDQARTAAKAVLYDMSNGVIKKEIPSLNITLGTAFEEYFKTRKSLKPRTILDYKKVINVYLKDWQKTPVLHISKEMVTKRHAKLGRRSNAQANMAMRVLRAVFNFAIATYPDITINPVCIISQTRAWYRVDRRQTWIKPHEFPVFCKAVMGLESYHDIDCAETVRDYLLFLLFTGMRPGEAQRLKWEDVDFQHKSFVLPDSKNKTPYSLPMSDYLYGLLKELQDRQVNDYVFPGRDGHIVEPKRQVKKVSEMTQISFMLTDLRRTFITIAEGLDLSYYAVKRLLNHKISGDVTAGYIVTDVERLRKPMQQITDYILKAAKLKETGKLIEFKNKQVQK